MTTSTRLEILEGSLIKKEAKFDAMLANHYATVKQANGQPLNDKRNGQATLNKWDRQEDALRNQDAEIKKTKTAIAREEGKIAQTQAAFDLFPDCIKTLIGDGTLKQWRKHPRILFVDGVDKARIYFKPETGTVSVGHHKEIDDKEQWKKLRDVFNGLAAELNRGIVQ